MKYALLILFHITGKKGEIEHNKNHSSGKRGTSKHRNDTSSRKKHSSGKRGTSKHRNDISSQWQLVAWNMQNRSGVVTPPHRFNPQSVIYCRPL